MESISRQKRSRTFGLGRVPIAAFALSIAAVLTLAGAALACTTADLGISSGDCSGLGDAATRTWTVTNSYTQESIEWSADSSFTSATTLTPKNQGSWQVQTASTVDTLYVRFVNFTKVEISATWDGGACPTPTPAPTATPTEAPTATPTEAPTATPTEAPTATPSSVVGGETATPVASVTAPPTSTTGGGSGNNSMPIFALLICVAFGALGLTAVEAQRRSIRR